MIWLLIGLQFVLTLASYLRWLRVAQREAYAPGRLISAMQQAVRSATRERVTLIVSLVFALLGLASVVLAFVAAALWFTWPRSLPLLDREAPLVWDGTAKRVAATIVVLHALVTAILVVATAIVGLYCVSLLPLTVISVGALALRLAGPRRAAA